MLEPLFVGFVDILGQRLEVPDLAIIGLLVVLEGVLSIDNALVLGLLAKRLPPQERTRALTYGLVGAFVFRVIAIATASLLLRWTFVKFLGGGYLVYIAVKHLFFESREEGGEKIELDEHGHPKLTDEKGQPFTEEREELEIRERVPFYMDRETRRRLGFAAFWPTVGVIELTDIAFAVDSILAAIALVGSPPPGTPEGAFHPKLWVVVTGGILGVVLMRFAAAIFIRLLERFPRFEVSAYLLVIVIGSKLLLDWGFNSDWSFEEPKWIANRMSPAVQENFHNLEVSRRGAVVSYEQWLKENWIFGLHGSHSAAHGEADHGEGAANDGHEHDEAQPAEADREHEAVDDDLDHDPLHVPHLLNFHDLRRPECLSFWLLMLICFGIGFIPKKQHGANSAA